MNSLGSRLLCVLGGLYLAACNGGPISDFPRGSNGGNDVGGGSGDGDQGSEGPSADAAVGEPTAPEDDGDDSEAPPAGGDAGVPPILDGGADAGDAGGPACTQGSDGRPSACYGLYCETTLEQLTDGTTQGAACSDASELALVCDGAIARSVTACLEAHVLSADARTNVTACVRGDGALTTASDACLGCHVEQALCALESCLGPCLSGLGDACQACQAELCGDAFYACSGLARP